jgi:apolipoprotein N-acyltransferase
VVHGEGEGELRAAPADHDVLADAAPLQVAGPGQPRPMPRCTLSPLRPFSTTTIRVRATMPRIVRGALLQASWTGDKESMIQKHEQAAHDAAKQGAQVMLFQELFYGPYFCQVQDPQYYSYTELIPDGPTTKRMQDLAQQTGMVLVVPMYEEDDKASGIYYNTAAVIDAA